MPKLELAPNDVRALLKNHPSIELELMNNAAEQMADALVRKCAGEQVANRVTYELERIVAERVSYNKSVLSPVAAQLINAEARRAIDESFAVSLSSVVMTMIRQEVQAYLPVLVRQVEKQVKEDLDGMIRDLLVQILLTPRK